VSNSAMTRPVMLLRFALLWVLLGLTLTGASADGLTLTASFGITGRYRPGTWSPVTVTVHNPNGETVSGQLQILASPTPGRGFAGGNAALGSALYARSVILGANASQQFIVYTRGIDPGHDTVSVQLMDGFKRGDGRLLARTDNEPTNSTPTITGGALADNDFFFVGFGGENGAYSFLNGQQVNLIRLPGGSSSPVTAAANPNRNGTGVPATAQVASPLSVNLPDKAAGYSGVDAFLLRSDAPLDALTEAQTEALKGWVTSGGHLIVVCNGIDPSPLNGAFFTGLLPAAIGPAGADGKLTLTPKSMSGVRSVPGLPSTITGPYGAGRVTITTASNFTSGQVIQMTGGLVSPSLLSHVAQREENYAPEYYGSAQNLLSDAVMRAPSLDAPGTEVIGLFLLFYLIVLVPVNYIVLKRLDRKELAWVTIPLLVLLFAGGTFAVGYAAKGGTVFLNRAAIVETTSGHRVAGAYTEIGLFSPHRTSYDITVPGTNSLAALPNPGYNYNFRSQNRGGEMQGNGQTKFVQSSNGTTLLDTSVNMWAMRAFDTQSTTDLGGTVDSSLSRTAAGVFGSLANHTKYDLSDCVILYGAQVQSLGSLRQGASLPIALGTYFAPGSGSLALPNLPGEMAGDESHTDVRQRMRWALVGYVRSLGALQSSNNYGNGQVQPAYMPTPHEALLIGWSDNPALAGPSPQIDGHSLKENDATVVIIHLPIADK